MENMQFVEELVMEFLVFRGFTKTLQAFESELCSDIGKGFQVDNYRLLDLIISVYIPRFEAINLVSLLSFFKQLFSSSTGTVVLATLSKLEISIHQETGTSAASHLANAELAQNWVIAGKAKEMIELSASKPISESESRLLNHGGGGGNGDLTRMLQDGIYVGNLVLFCGSFTGQLEAIEILFKVGGA